MTVEQWDEAADWPLMGAALAFLGAYAVPILLPDMSAGAKGAWILFSWSIWALFVVDFAVRLWLTEGRRNFLLANVVDLIIIALPLAIMVLPLLGPLLLLRLVIVLRTLNRHATDELKGRVVTYLIGGTILLGFSAALAILDAERQNPDANIKSFGDALWCVAATMSTTGYGDRYPTTGEGRFAAVMLMVGGIGMLGMVTSILATWLANKVKAADPDDVAHFVTWFKGFFATRADRRHDELIQELAALRQEVARLSQCADGERPEHLTR